MNTILRRHLLALMLGVTTVTFSSALLFETSAIAKDGSDDGGSHDSGDDHGGSSGGSDDGPGHDSGDDDGDSSGSDDDSDDSPDSDDDSDDSGSGTSGSDDDDDSNDDSSGDSGKKAKKAERTEAKSNARPTAIITLSDTSLANVRAGTHVVVDQIGRQLEIRVVMVNGQQVIRAKPHGGDAKHKPGPITDISVVPVSTAPGNDDGTPDQGPGDN